MKKSIKFLSLLFLLGGLSSLACSQNVKIIAMEQINNKIKNDQTSLVVQTNNYSTDSDYIYKSFPYTIVDLTIDPNFAGYSTDISNAIMQKSATI